jgi:hypothetical protein
MKAVVIQKSGNRVTLLQNDGRFVSRPDRDYAIGDEIMIRELSIQKKLSMAAAAAALVIVLGLGVFAYVTPSYYVSVDVNPGMLLGVNRFERVINAEAMNDDAVRILDRLSWENKSVEDAVTEAITIIDEEGYLDQEGEILITAAGKNEEKAAEMAAELGNAVNELNLKEAHVSAEGLGYEDVQTAKDLGMTPGKYNLITKHLGETVNESNIEEYNQTSVKDLMSEFTAKKQAEGQAVADAAKDKNQNREQEEEQNGTAATSGETEQNKAQEQREGAAETSAQETRQQAEQNGSTTNDNKSQAAENRPTEPAQGQTQGTQPSEPLGETEQNQETEQREGAAETSAQETRQQTEQNGTAAESQEPAGTSGAAGATGATGEAGSAGEASAQGAAGTTGTSGAAGSGAGR